MLSELAGLSSILGGGGSTPAWVQKQALGQMAVIFFMPFLMSIFLPAQVEPSVYQDEMDQILDGYNKMTGRSPSSEEIWALTGVYSQYGYDINGNPSSAYGVTDDGWIFGARAATYSPTQYHAEYVQEEKKWDYIPGQGTPDGGQLTYIVERDDAKGLYYYKWVGDDLNVDYKYPDDEYEGEGSDEHMVHHKGEIKSDHPQLYTRVHMDTAFQSQIFITHGGKHQMEDGTFYYEFNGYRYSFSPLQDYSYDKNTNIQAKNSSCSLIWYQYTSDSGIQGQLVVSGTDKGVQYITGQSIVQAFDAATSTAKFTFSFSGVDVYLYVQLDPYMLAGGMTPADCYKYGYFSVMLTTPKYVSSSGSGQTISFDINKMWDVMVGLFTFSPEKYGLEEGSISGMVASVVFIMPLYAALLGMGVICWPMIIMLALVQQISQIWPF